MESFKGKVRHIAESVSQVKPGRLRRPKGKVALRMEKNFDPQGNLLEERYRSHKRINRITYQYNSQGLCTERLEFSFDHVLFFRYKYKYDRWGHQIEALCFNPDGTLSHAQSSRYNQRGEEVEKRIRKGESIESVKYIYDDHGNICEEYTTLNGKFAAHRRYQYDDHGNKTQDTFRNADMETTDNNWRYTYDPQGHIVEQHILSDDQTTILSAYTFTYDDHGRRICTTHRDSDGNFSTHRIFLDDQGRTTLERWRTKKHYDTDQQLCGERSIIYDHQNRILEESVRTGLLTCQQQQLQETDQGVAIITQYTGQPTQLSYLITHQYSDAPTPTLTHTEHYNNQGQLIQESTIRYDHQGNLLEECQVEHTPSGKIETRDRYEHDTIGNWTLKETIINGQTDQIITRAIEYWDDTPTQQ